jgi:hypothetical protein
MKKICLLFGMVAIAHLAHAQNYDALMLRNPYVTCQDVTFNAARLIRQLHQKSEIDSLYNFLTYWEDKCGTNEAIYQLRVVLDIKTANFDTAQVTKELFEHLLAFRPVQHPELNSYFPIAERPLVIRDYEVALKNITLEIQKIAASIEQTYSTDEALIAEFFKSESPTFDGIKNASAEKSKLRKIYDEELRSVLRMPEGHMALFAGYYQPFQKLEIFGPHPTIGVLLGFKQKRHNFDFAFDVRFGRSKNEYEFLYNGTLMQDDRWTSIYVGLEYTYNFIETKRFRAGLSPGLGYNGITAVRADEDEDKDSKILPSYDVNGGLVLKYHYGKRGGYTGLQLRYHWVDHRNAGGTELNGSYLSVRLIIGSIFNEWREYKLNQMK